MYINMNSNINGKQACVICNGCPESRIDSARVTNYLVKNEWSVVNDCKEADLILFNTCGNTENAARRSLDILYRLKKEKKESAKLIVFGCLPKIDPDSLKQEYDGPLFGESDIESLDKIIGATVPINDITAHWLVPREEVATQNKYGIITGLPKFIVSKWEGYLFRQANLWQKSNSYAFYIKASTGCLGNCSYCAIRKSRGKIRSKNLDEILSEFKDGLKKAFKRISLLGTDLGWQGMDKGYTLVNLLREMIKEKGDYKIGLRNVNPVILIRMLDELEPLFASNRIWYLGTAAESGSDRILNLMNRGYTSADFKNCIRTLRKVSPKLVIRTQIMVGFPTETENDFQESVQLVNELKFDYVECFGFSVRPGVKAAELDGKVPEEIIGSRYRYIHRRTLMPSTIRWIERSMK